jgi:hypothetical protein
MQIEIKPRSKLLCMMLKIKERVACSRPPDVVIGGKDNPYLLRWHVIPRNRFFNIYLHLFLRSDDDRALHDHPWANASFLIDGAYVEHTISQGGINRRKACLAGDFSVRLSGKKAHRIELTNGPCWTIFITGPRYRQWGFHCPDAGWRHWQDFTSKHDSGQVGRGCE